MTHKRNIVLIGQGRSGTSWAQKVFDNNPDILSVFEPRASELAKMADASDPMQTAHDIVDSILSCRTLRAMRKRPILRKNFHSTPAHYARIAYMYGASLLTEVLSLGDANKVNVPDLKGRADPVTVTKMVSLVQWLPELARSSPDVLFVLLIRHPCGFVASNLDGIERGKMPKGYLPKRDVMDELFTFDKPIEELTEDDFNQRDIFAMRWAVQNHRAVAGVKGLPNVHIATYEDLCDDPLDAFQKMFAACGLGWHEKCDAFLRNSVSTSTDSAQYHGLKRNPSIAANRWRDTLSAEDVAAIRRYATPSAASPLFDDFSAQPTAAE